MNNKLISDVGEVEIGSSLVVIKGVVDIPFGMLKTG